MRFYYVNSENKRINFYDSPYLLQGGSLLDYTYSYSIASGKRLERIKDIKKEVQEKELEIAIITDNTLPTNKREKQFAEAANHLLEMAECDILSGKKGRIYEESGYYIEGYIISNTKNKQLFFGRFMNTTLKFVADPPLWCREKTYSFKASTKEIVDAERKEEIENTLDNATLTPDSPWDYPKDYFTKYKPAKKNRLFDYNFDFYQNHTVAKLDNDHFAASNFKMIVYGPCTHPQIQIGGHIYEVNTTLYDGEYMVIDSRERTAVKYTRYGAEENLFNARSREYDLFQKIPAGKLLVKWNRQYPFDLILYQERSEPPWNV